MTVNIEVAVLVLPTGQKTDLVPSIFNFVYHANTINHV